MTYDYSATVNYLLDWYDLNARFLVWRENPKPYYVWVSEIMLQQTRVEAVKFYFDRFIDALPDIKSLAEAEEEKLLKLWEGLGYYNRVRNLKKAAEIVMLDYNGEMPADYDALLKLPGIGAYTAGAIASIAFQIPEPAVDGNVLRVMKRVAGSYDDITKESVKKELIQDLRKILPKDRPGDFNQAVMDLGSAICIPNGRPICDDCPIMHLCSAFHNGTQMAIPVKSVKKARKIEEKTILLIEKDGKYAIHKRENKGLLAGLWEFPNIEGKLSKRQVEAMLKEMGIDPFSITSLEEGKHIFSHIEWHMTGYHIKIQEDSVVAETENYETKPSSWPNSINGSGLYNWSSPINWADKSQIIHEFSLPTAFEIYRKHIIDSGDISPI
jgi:A/G-specific adenine glycosylase